MRTANSMPALSSRRPSRRATPASKRRRTSPDEDSGYFSSQESGRNTVDRSPTSSEDSGLLLACPYFKFSPTQNTRCVLRNQLKSTSFVMQHLDRCHKVIRCSRCNISFENSKEYEKHTTSFPSCQVKEPAASSTDEDRLLGIDQNDLNKLRGSRLSHRRLTEVDRWFAIWDYLFPNTPRPECPYVGSPEDEILGITKEAIKAKFPDSQTVPNLLDFMNWSTVSAAVGSPRPPSPPYDTGSGLAFQQNADDLEFCFDFPGPRGPGITYNMFEYIYSPPDPPSSSMISYSMPSPYLSLDFTNLMDSSLGDGSVPLPDYTVKI